MPESFVNGELSDIRVGTIHTIDHGVFGTNDPDLTWLPERARGQAAPTRERSAPLA